MRTPVMAAQVFVLAGLSWATLGVDGCSATNITIVNDNTNTNSIESDCCGCCDCDCECEEEDTSDPGDTGEGACECPVGFELNPEGDGCIATDTVAATYSGTTYKVCKGTQDAVYGKFGAQYPGGLTVQDGYWGQDNSTADGRLNEIGIWACQDDPTTTTVDEPTGEWIGFSVCVDIEEAGDYLVGIAADNRVKFSVNGVLEFEKNSYTTAHFNYWYVQPVSLSSGLNIIEMYGYNDGAIATFGAEIAGPFAAGAFVDDASMAAADYAGNIVWSTADMEGGVFDLGDASGWSCPDDYALNTCESEPTCTLIETAPCVGDEGPGDTGSGDTGGGTGSTGDPTD